MTAKNLIDPEVAFAFLNVVAPKLEQLRRRLVAADKVLKEGNPETARLNAITESQLAVREFLVGIPPLSSLVDPIDTLLEAVREEPEESAPPPAAAPAVPAGDTPPSPNVDRWLQVGTVLAVQRLMAAGMAETPAELFVRDAFAAISLRLHDASPITDAAIKEWRNQLKSARRGRGWRGGSPLRRKTGGGITTLAEAKQRVADLAATLKHMSDLGAGN